MTLRALGRTHLPSAPDGAPGGYVLIRQSDSPGVPVLASPEPTLLPKLRVYFAEFPYPQYPAPEAVRLGDLLRFRYGRVHKRVPLFTRARRHARGSSQQHASECARAEMPLCAPWAARVKADAPPPYETRRISSPSRRCGAALRPGSLLAETLLLVGPWRQARYSLQDLRARTLHSASPRCFFASEPPHYSNFNGNRAGLRGDFKRPPFSARTDSAGKLRHTSWRVPTSMATGLLS